MLEEQEEEVVQNHPPENIYLDITLPRFWVCEASEQLPGVGGEGGCGGGPWSCPTIAWSWRKVWQLSFYSGSGSRFWRLLGYMENRRPWCLSFSLSLKKFFILYCSIVLLGESHGQRSLVGYSSQGHKESNTTEATAHTCTHSWLTVLCQFQILCPFRLLQNVEYSSLCYTAGPCWLSILNIVVCICFF